MAVTLTVSEMRQALFRESGHVPGDGEVSCPSAGRIFHRVLAELLRGESDGSLGAVLRLCEPDLEGWRTRLREHAYDQLLGPLLTRQAAEFEGRSGQVLSLWKAVQSACDWLAGLWWEMTGQGTREIVGDDWFRAEVPLLREFVRPDWSEPVAVVGHADAVLEVPGTAARCLIEYKLGRSSPALDLAQTALYHLLLEGEGNSAQGAALAVVSFKPEREETVFSASRLGEARERLVDLIGRLANVKGRATAVAAPAPISIPHLAPAMKMTSAAGGQSHPEVPLASASSDAGANVGDSQACSAGGWVALELQRLLKLLRQFGTPCRAVGDPVVGPTFARFFVFPERGVLPKKVMGQADQLHLHLGLSSPPTMAIIEGRIGIDLPRPDRVSLPFSALVPHLPPIEPLQGNARVPAGVDLAGQWQWIDFASPESPHALVVGTTGSGKSEWLRAAVATLMATNTPQTLKLLVIDPKQLAFGFCHGAPFLTRPVVIPSREEVPVSEILHEIVNEMHARNARLAASGSSDLRTHVQRTGTPMPRIVVVCDEFSALLNGATKTERAAIEHEFKQIAEMSRACGCHLVLATQHPRANVLTNSIRSLLPAKVALRVSSALESRIALEESGAERLLGHGDLLYKCVGNSVRLQGAWLPAADEAGFRGASGATVESFRVRDVAGGAGLGLERSRAKATP